MYGGVASTGLQSMKHQPQLTMLSSPRPMWRGSSIAFSQAVATCVCPIKQRAVRSDGLAVCATSLHRAAKDVLERKKLQTR